VRAVEKLEPSDEENSPALLRHGRGAIVARNQDLLIVDMLERADAKFATNR
jgi:hypothetical protein